jgi:choline dehydrogenase-like flavoprotein
LTAPTALIGQSFFSTSDVKRTGVNWPNIQMFFLPVSPSKAFRDSLSRAVSIDHSVLSSVMDSHEDRDGFMLLPILVRPKGVGDVTLKDKNPFSDPLIDPRCMEHPDDAKALVEGMKYM